MSSAQRLVEIIRGLTIATSHLRNNPLPVPPTSLLETQSEPLPPSFGLRESQFCSPTMDQILERTDETAPGSMHVLRIWVFWRGVHVWCCFEVHYETELHTERIHHYTAFVFGTRWQQALLWARLRARQRGDRQYDPNHFPDVDVATDVVHLS